MASFLEKLGIRKEQEKEQPLKTSREEDSGIKVLQLDVDIYRKADEILVYAQIPGASSDDLSISINSDSDVLIIKGKKKIPEEEVYFEETKKEKTKKEKTKKEKTKKEETKKGGEGKWIYKECQWGSFYRQIILPEEVDSSKTKAEFKRGVLALKLPLLKPKTGKVKVEIKEE